MFLEEVLLTIRKWDGPREGNGTYNRPEKERGRGRKIT